MTQKTVDTITLQLLIILHVANLTGLAIFHVISGGARQVVAVLFWAFQLVAGDDKVAISIAKVEAEQVRRNSQYQYDEVKGGE